VLVLDKLNPGMYNWVVYNSSDRRNVDPLDLLLITHVDPVRDRLSLFICIDYKAIINFESVRKILLAG
jgi:hypothetical protein